MDAPVVSILLPSRKRPGQLLGSIASFFYTSPPDSNFEILVRLDDDDHNSLYYLQDFEAIPRVRVITGPSNAPPSTDHGLRRKLNEIYTELALQARAYWLWVWNDDAWVRGNTWYQQLQALIGQRALVLTNDLQNQQSFYKGASGEPFPIFPNGCWREFGLTGFPEPIDAEMNKLLRAHWPELRLQNVCAVHDWRSHNEHGPQGGLAE